MSHSDSAPDQKHPLSFPKKISAGEILEKNGAFTPQFPEKFVFGTGGRTRTYEDLRREIYSLLSLPLDDSGKVVRKFVEIIFSLQKIGAASGTRTQDLLFTKQLL